MAVNKKPRKPKTLLNLKGEYRAGFRKYGEDLDDYPILISFTGRRYDVSLQAAKRLHKWLGRAIAYLENLK